MKFVSLLKLYIIINLFFLSACGVNPSNSETQTISEETVKNHTEDEEESRLLEKENLVIRGNEPGDISVEEIGSRAFLRANDSPDLEEGFIDLKSLSQSIQFITFGFSVAGEKEKKKRSFLFYDTPENRTMAGKLKSGEVEVKAIRVYYKKMTAQLSLGYSVGIEDLFTIEFNRRDNIPVDFYAITRLEYYETSDRDQEIIIHNFDYEDKLWLVESIFSNH